MATNQKPVLRGDTFWINVQIEGKRLRKSLNTSDAKLAAEAFTRELAEFYRTRKFKELPKKTLNDAFDQWLKERSTKRSIEDDQRKIEYFRDKLGTMQLSALKSADIEKHLPESVTPSTRVSTVSPCNSIDKKPGLMAPSGPGKLVFCTACTLTNNCSSVSLSALPIVPSGA